MQKRLLHIVILLLWIVMSVHAQKYEYWLDGDYNHRTVSAYNGGDISANMDVSDLKPGLHFYNIRIQYDNGLWGPINRYLFMVPENVMSVHAQRYEYWLDGDYNHRTVSAYNGGDISANMDVSDLKPGLHFYNIRIQYDNGIWGPINRYLFMMPEGTTILPMAIEYWIDDKTPVILPVSGSTVTLTSDVSMLEPGNHLFSCRVQATNGTWSDIHSREFTIEILPVEISGAFIEYYIDSDPGYGKGTLVKATENSDNEFDVNLADTKPGAHVLYVRTYDGQGHWSSTASHPLYVRNPVSIAEVEYFVDADPGKGKGVSVSLPENLSEPFDLKISTDGLLYGEHLFGIRAKDSDGLWTYNTTRPFTLARIAGDVNDDHIVNNADIADLMNYILGKPSDIFNEDAADVNGDGVVNVADIVEIVKIIKANK